MDASFEIMNVNAVDSFNAISCPVPFSDLDRQVSLPSLLADDFLLAQPLSPLHNHNGDMTDLSFAPALTDCVVDAADAFLPSFASAASSFVPDAPMAEPAAWSIDGGDSPAHLDVESDMMYDLDSADGYSSPSASPLHEDPLYSISAPPSPPTTLLGLVNSTTSAELSSPSRTKLKAAKEDKPKKRRPHNHSSEERLNKRKKTAHGGSQQSASVASAESRKKVSNACESCYKAKSACDDGRPCSRCVRLGKGHSCRDRQHKRYGRPKKFTTTASAAAAPFDNTREAQLKEMETKKRRKYNRKGGPASASPSSSASASSPLLVDSDSSPLSQASVSPTPLDLPVLAHCPATAAVVGQQQQDELASHYPTVKITTVEGSMHLQSNGEVARQLGYSDEQLYELLNASFFAPLFDATTPSSPFTVLTSQQQHALLVNECFAGLRDKFDAQLNIRLANGDIYSFRHVCSIVADPVTRALHSAVLTFIPFQFAF